MRDIITIGHDTLSQKAARIENLDEAVRDLARDMVETLYAAPGIGLAAPQVNAPVRLIIVDLSIGQNPKDLIIMINPEILARQGSCVREEGCLSVPGIYEKVTRPFNISVRGLDLDGKEKIIDAEDLLARVFFHEIDHLDGKLFVDRLSPLKRSLIRKKLKKAEAKA